MSELAEQLANLEYLLGRQAETVRELKRSLALVALCGKDLFKETSVRSYVQGSPAKGYKFYVKTKERTREFEIKDVPELLLNGKINRWGVWIPASS